VNNQNDVVLVPSVPTLPAVLVSSEADTYIGLLIVAILWAFFSGAVVALSEHDASSQKSAARWAVSFVVASLVGAYFLWMLL
jgi:VIT1/CCC1 family predicted Fe2+/Mn2+ transporter